MSELSNPHSCATAVSAQVLLAKPVTFMNNSGESVSALARFYKVPTQRILVVSDDLDMPHAALRLRAKGGHGGHNGLRSISERLGNTQVSSNTAGVWQGFQAEQLWPEAP
jgi:PTH1 family peptidyl-tRNA hydrolase